MARATGKCPAELAFWATHAGAEVDIFWQEHGRNWAVEVKYSSAPKLTPSMAHAIQDLQLAHLWVVYPGEKAYALNQQATAIPLAAIPPNWHYPHA